MDVRDPCANCGAELPQDATPGTRYCATCAAAWSAGPTVTDGPEPDAARSCANCGDPLPADQPDGHAYCARCAAAWQRGGTAARS